MIKDKTSLNCTVFSSALKLDSAHHENRGGFEQHHSLHYLCHEDRVFGLVCARLSTACCMQVHTSLFWIDVCGSVGLLVSSFLWICFRWVLVRDGSDCYLCLSSITSALHQRWYPDSSPSNSSQSPDLRNTKLMYVPRKSLRFGKYFMGKILWSVKLV